MKRTNSMEPKEFSMKIYGECWDTTDSKQHSCYVIIFAQESCSLVTVAMATKNIARTRISTRNGSFYETLHGQTMWSLTMMRIETIFVTMNYIVHALDKFYTLSFNIGPHALDHRYYFAYF